MLKYFFRKHFAFASSFAGNYMHAIVSFELREKNNLHIEWIKKI